MTPPIPKELRKRLNGDLMCTPDGRHGIVVYTTPKYVFLMFEVGVYERFAKYEVNHSSATLAITPQK